MQMKRCALIIADISGYTRFTQYHAMAMLHAEQLISDLLEAVIDAAKQPLVVNKLEGDAVFFYAESQGDDGALAKAVLAQLKGLFEAFHQKERALFEKPVCVCSACRQAGTLRLKIIVHFGDVALKKIRTFEELAGAPVIATYRLTKNSVQSSEYILLTEAFQALSGDVAGLTAEDRVEALEGMGTMPVKIYYPYGKVLSKSRQTQPLMAVIGGQVEAEVSAAPSATPAMPQVQSAVVLTPEPTPAPTPVAATTPIEKPSFGQRLRQYLRVNGHALRRFFRLTPKRNFRHLADSQLSD
jgi:class 3 adenylate cyclase